MRGLFLFICFVFSTFSQPVLAESKGGISSPHIVADYKVPDHNADAVLLIDRFKRLTNQLDALEAGQNPEDLDEALKLLNTPIDIKRYKREFRRELAIVNETANVATYLSLAKSYQSSSQFKDALSILHLALQMDIEPEIKASALAQMADIYNVQGHVIDAINLYALALELNDERSYRRHASVLIEKLDLRIKDVSTDSSSDLAQACIHFNQPLQNAKALDAKGYIKLSPQEDVSYSATHDKICIRGLRYGQDYEVTVKAGLRGTDQGIMSEASKRSVFIGDRDARILLNPGSYVLPSSNKGQLPIRTINVDEAHLKLYRVGERNLTALQASGLLTQNLSSWNETQLEYDYGTAVAEAYVKTSGEKNKEVTTLIPVNELIKEPKPGIYILTARDNGEEETYYYSSRPTQWLLISDIGVTSYHGESQMQVHTRSLKNAKPQSGVELTLISRNNEILGRAKSDSRGIAEFPAGLMRGEGGNRPQLLIAQKGDGDFNFLTLNGPYLDVSGLGVAGQAALKASNTFLYTERGVYRPGETVFLSGLLRDAQSKAVKAKPLTFKVVRPDGVVIFEKRINGDELGGYNLEIPINAAARAGRYYASAYHDPEGSSIGSVYFQVEDFVPQRITASLSTEAEIVIPKQPFDLELEAEFLYGAPASDLNVDGQVIIQSNRRPFEAHKDYVFGPEEEEFRPQRHFLTGPKTDASGKSRITYSLNDVPQSDTPLEAGFRVQVADVSGRPVGSYLTRPILTKDLHIGLKRGNWDEVEDGAIARFSAISVNAKGEEVAGKKLVVDWFKEHNDYNWYYNGGEWEVRTQVYDEIVYSENMTGGDDGLVQLEHQLPHGRYRIQVKDEDGNAVSSMRFYVGWVNAGNNAITPDALEINVDQTSVASGDKVRAFIKAPFAGEALVAVANDRIRWTKSIRLSKEGTEISIPMDEDWRPGAYILATAFRPNDGKPSLLPHRAMGLAWVGIDTEAAQYKLSLNKADIAKPRAQTEIDIEVSGYEKKHGPLKITLAAVDEGILQLTDFTSPSPVDYFLTQRVLGVQIRDLYGRLIKAADGQLGELRFGGDAELAQAEENTQGLKKRAQKTVALFHKDVSVDENGHARVTLDIPDFAGRLRLMAVAYSADRIAEASSDIIIRDDLIAELLLPRFLSPGDEAQSKLSLHNLKDEEVELTVSLEAEGLALGQEQWTVKLAPQERQDIPVSLMAGAPQDGQLNLTVAEGDDVVQTRDWTLPIRAVQPYTSDRNITLLKSGESYTIDASSLGDYFDDTLEASFKLTTRPDFDIADLLLGLSRYPYGCTEQTVSRAMPLLYFNDVALEWGVESDKPALDKTLYRSIDRVLNRQNSDGSFGLWRSGSNGHLWLSAYSVEFLTRARDKGYDVPPKALAFAIDWLETQALSERYRHPHSAAYAFYILAREGQISLSETRYFADRFGASIETPLGLAHLGAALSLLGDVEEGEKFLINATKTHRNPFRWYDDYGSDLRDQAAIAALIADIFRDEDRLNTLTTVLEDKFYERNYFSTQEQNWLLLTTHALQEKAADQFSFALNDDAFENQTQAQSFSFKADEFKTGLLIENTGNDTLRLIHSLRGISKAALPPVQEKVQISRRYLSPTGAAIDPMDLKQNDLVLVVLEGKTTGNTEHDFLIVDLLPAGLEIENAAIGGAGTSAFQMPKLTRTIDFEAARDDRYIAALSPGYRGKEFRVAYLARAVTPGSFAQPAPFVEDMNRPQIFARGEIGKIIISPR